MERPVLPWNPSILSYTRTFLQSRCHSCRFMFTAQTLRHRTSLTVCHRSLPRNSSTSLHHTVIHSSSSPHYHQNDKCSFVTPIPTLPRPTHPTQTLQTRHLRFSTSNLLFNCYLLTPLPASKKNVLPKVYRNFLAVGVVEICRVGKKFFQCGTPDPLGIMSPDSPEAPL